MRTCSQCNLEKDLSEFVKSRLTGKKGKCKCCQKENRKTNKKIISDYNKNYYLENKTELDVQHIENYYKNKEQYSDYGKTYYKLNKSKRLNYQNVYSKIRRKIDPTFRLRQNISSSIRSAIKNTGNKKKGSIVNKLPYKMQELKDHLEKQFETWMTWENYGIYNRIVWNDNDQTTWTWQIDHIIPHSTFYYISMDEAQFQKCWALENLRPYSAKQNFIDGTTKIRHK